MNNYQIKLHNNQFHRIHFCIFMTIKFNNKLISYCLLRNQFYQVQLLILNERTALHLAVEEEQIEIITLLLKCKDIDTNIKDEI